MMLRGACGAVKCREPEVRRVSRSEVAANALVASLVVAATYGLLWLLVRITDILVLMLICS